MGNVYFLVEINDSVVRSTGKKEVKLSINNDIISQNNSHKFLGIWFDSRLTWSTHIDSIVEKYKKTVEFITMYSWYAMGRKLPRIDDGV